MPFTIEQLIHKRPRPVTVQQNDSVKRALDLMIEHDFSQLPVEDEGRRPIGIISSDSILRALAHFGVTSDSLGVSSATFPCAKFRKDEILFELLNKLKESRAALVVDAEGELLGIITDYDTTEYFRRRAEDMMLVEDIETTVKDYILAAFTDRNGGLDEEALSATISDITDSTRATVGQLQKGLRSFLKSAGLADIQVTQDKIEEVFPTLAAKKAPKPFDKLTLYDYTELLLHRKCWSAYSEVFRMDAKAVRTLLQLVQKTRNDLAHFRGEITSTQRDQLRFCSQWLSGHQPLMQMLAGDAGVVIVETESIANGSESENRSTLMVRDLVANDSRYAPLSLWLKNRPPDQERINLTFRQVEEILKDKLPLSARQHRAWWANDSSDYEQSKYWLQVGWKVLSISLADEVVVFAKVRDREKAYNDFFSGIVEKLRTKADFPVTSSQPDGQSWYPVIKMPLTGPPVLILAYDFTSQSRFRVEVLIEAGSKERNRQIFNQLYAEKTEIEGVIGESLNWERMNLYSPSAENSRHASRIALYRSGVITDDKESLSQLQDWAVDSMIRFRAVFGDRLMKALEA